MKSVISMRLARNLGLLGLMLGYFVLTPPLARADYSSCLNDCSTYFTGDRLTSCNTGCTEMYDGQYFQGLTFQQDLNQCLSDCPSDSTYADACEYGCGRYGAY